MNSPGALADIEIMPTVHKDLTPFGELITATFKEGKNDNKFFMANVNIRPIGDRILIKYIEDKEQMRGGIIIPDSAKEKPQEAHVVSLGTGRKGKDGTVIPFEVKVGDKILVGKYGTTEVKIGEVKHTLAREDDILAVLT